MMPMSRHHDAHTSIDDSSVNSLSAHSHLGSTQMQGGSTLESVQSNVLGDSFSPSDHRHRLRRSRRRCSRCSTTVSDTVGTLTNDVAGVIAPVEAAVQPVLATVTDTVGTLTNDVAGHDRAGRGGGAAGARRP